MTLKTLPEKALEIVSYFDNMDFFDFGENSFPVGMQYFYRLIPEKRRKELEQYRDNALIEKIKERCTDGIQEWFIDKEPF
jgi:hypothetical protein